MRIAWKTWGNSEDWSDGSCKGKWRGNWSRIQPICGENTPDKKIMCYKMWALSWTLICGFAEVKCEEKYTVCRVGIPNSTVITTIATVFVKLRFRTYVVVAATGDHLECWVVSCCDGRETDGWFNDGLKGRNVKMKANLVERSKSKWNDSIVEEWCESEWLQKSTMLQEKRGSKGTEEPRIHARDSLQSHSHSEMSWELKRTGTAEGKWLDWVGAAGPEQAWRIEPNHKLEEEDTVWGVEVESQRKKEIVREAQSWWRKRRNESHNLIHKLPHVAHRQTHWSDVTKLLKEITVWLWG
jgi:hypothetical protein